jgi:hypothetical protein
VKKDESSRDNEILTQNLSIQKLANVPSYTSIYTGYYFSLVIPTTNARLDTMFLTYANMLYAIGTLKSTNQGFQNQYSTAHVTNT